MFIYSFWSITSLSFLNKDYFKRQFLEGTAMWIEMIDRTLPSQTFNKQIQSSRSFYYRLVLFT